MSASLENLPAPLPLIIIESLPDLKALYALRCSSPLYSVVYAQDAAKIFELIAQKSISREVAIEMRLFVLLYLNKSRRSSNELKTLYNHAQKPLPKDTQGHAIDCALRMFCSIHSAVDEILRCKMVAVRSLPYEHLEDPSFRYELLGPPPHRPSGKPYSLQPSSPIQWIEEQRAARALWRMINLNYATVPLDSLEPWQSNSIAAPWNNHPMAVDEISEIRSSLGATESKLLDQISHTSMSWNSPVAGRDPYYPWVETLTATSVGWNIFHTALTKVPNRPFYQHEDYWPALRALGLGFWSEQRMGEEFELTRRRKAQIEQSQVSEQTQSLRMDNVAFTWEGLYLATKKA